MRTTMRSAVHQCPSVLLAYMLIDERERQHVAVQIAHSAHVPRERFARLAIVGRDDDLFSITASDRRMPCGTVCAALRRKRLSAT